MDYSYQDMLRMQEDAANRVREMKKRSSITAEEYAAESKTAKETCDTVKAVPAQKNERSDSLLIQALIALLSAENADAVTIIALMYFLL